MMRDLTRAELLRLLAEVQRPEKLIITGEETEAMITRWAEGEGMRTYRHHKKRDTLVLQDGLTTLEICLLPAGRIPEGVFYTGDPLPDPKFIPFDMSHFSDPAS